MIIDLMRARTNVEICEDILLSSSIMDQKNISPELKDAYEKMLESTKILYFMLSEAINMEKVQELHIINPLEKLTNGVLTEE